MKLPKLKNTETPELSYSEVIAPGSIYRAWVKTVRNMSDNIGITAPSLFINGKYFAWNEVCLHSPHADLITSNFKCSHGTDTWLRCDLLF